ncbi:hypothetical protein PAL_GLEAN10003797 [Pteropus alecto]|uniref:Uncharacterized protein n=1 Tax=Pteropus alecto TaxID=9402 RepID=L5L635_PTEAL|nr:hypothetical protein PAL_GLEAN10003797 [Pteropus alecto]
MHVGVCFLKTSSGPALSNSTASDVLSLSWPPCGSDSSGSSRRPDSMGHELPCRTADGHRFRLPSGTYRLEDSGYTRRKQRRPRLVACSPGPLFPGPKFEAVLSLYVFISKGASTWRVLFKSTFSYPLGILL